MFRLPACLIVCLLLLMQGCASSVPSSLTNSALNRDHDWTRITLDGSGFDVAAMRRLDADLEAGAFPKIHMVLVEQGARLVFEKYLAGDDWIWVVPAAIASLTSTVATICVRFRRV